MSAATFTDCYGNEWDREQDAKYATALYTLLDTQPHASDDEITAQLVAQFPDEYLPTVAAEVGAVRDAWPHSLSDRFGN